MLPYIYSTSMHNIMHTTRVCIVVRVLAHILASSRSIYTTSRLQYMNRVCIIFNTEPPQHVVINQTSLSSSQKSGHPSRHIATLSTTREVRSRGRTHTES